MPKWSRIKELEPSEELRLQKIVKDTPGMTLYGLRARVAVMLPVALAEHISEEVESREKTVGQIIVDILTEKFIPTIEYKCSECGGINIQEEAWVDVNSGKLKSLQNAGTCWCDDCHDHVKIQEIT